MRLVTLDFLTPQLYLSEQLRAGRETLFEPQDLPGRDDRVVNALDHLLEATGCESVVSGGWAAWKLGYVGRVTRDIDIVETPPHFHRFPSAVVDHGRREIVERIPIYVSSFGSNSNGKN